MKIPFTIIALTLTLSLNAQKPKPDYSFARAFKLTTTAPFPDPSSVDFKEIKQNVTIRLNEPWITITRLGTSTFLGSLDSLNVKKVTYTKKDSCTKVTTTQGITIENYPLVLYVIYPKVKKIYRMDMMEIKDEVKVKAPLKLITPKQ